MSLCDSHGIILFKYFQLQVAFLRIKIDTNIRKHNHLKNTLYHILFFKKISPSIIARSWLIFWKFKRKKVTCRWLSKTWKDFCFIPNKPNGFWNCRSIWKGSKNSKKNIPASKNAPVPRRSYHWFYFNNDFYQVAEIRKKATDTNHKQISIIKTQNIFLPFGKVANASECSVYGGTGKTFFI